MVKQIHRVYTTFDEKEIKRLYEDSYLEMQDIANRFGVSRSSINKKIQSMRERGLISFYRGRGGMSHRKQRGKVLLQKGFSKKYVSYWLCVDITTVRSWAREIGLSSYREKKNKVRKETPWRVSNDSFFKL